MILIFIILEVTYLLSLIVPVGHFECVDVNVEGMTVSRVIPRYFSFITDHPSIHSFQIFVSILKGLLETAPYLFIVFIAGALFHILQSTGALESLIGVSVRKIDAHRSSLLMNAGTFIRLQYANGLDLYGVHGRLLSHVKTYVID